MAKIYPCASTTAIASQHMKTMAFCKKGGKLFQQYIVDAYCEVEENNLNFLRFHQKELRAENYEVLSIQLSADEPVRVGRRVILPSSFTGGPRSQGQHYQDNMTIVSNFGKPDLLYNLHV